MLKVKRQINWHTFWLVQVMIMSVPEMIAVMSLGRRESLSLRGAVIVASLWFLFTALNIGFSRHLARRIE